MFVQADKNELRDGKQRSRVEMEKLEQQVKAASSARKMLDEMSASIF